MTRRTMFIELQREILRPLVDMHIIEPTDNLREMNSLPHSLGHNALLIYAEHCFIKEKVFRDGLANRIERYSIPLNDDSNEQCSLLDEFVYNFNPELIYFCVLKTPIEDDKTNFYLVKMTGLAKHEKSTIIDRAEQLLDVLKYSEHYYNSVNNPLTDLIYNIENIVLRLNPSDASRIAQNVHFGKPYKWISGEAEAGIPSGLLVKYEKNRTCSLNNCSDSKRSEHLFNNEVLFRIIGYDRYCEYGDLVSILNIKAKSYHLRKGSNAKAY